MMAIMCRGARSRQGGCADRQESQSMSVRILALAAALCACSPALSQHVHHPKPPQPGPAMSAPREPGQSAFAAIQEIVALLEADPGTDWTKVDIEALRRHLVDM